MPPLLPQDLVSSVPWWQDCLVGSGAVGREDKAGLLVTEPGCLFVNRLGTVELEPEGEWREAGPQPSWEGRSAPVLPPSWGLAYLWPSTVPMLPYLPLAGPGTLGWGWGMASGCCGVEGEASCWGGGLGGLMALNAPEQASRLAALRLPLESDKSVPEKQRASLQRREVLNVPRLCHHVS